MIGFQCSMFGASKRHTPGHRRRLAYGLTRFIFLDPAACGAAGRPLLPIAAAQPDGRPVSAGFPDCPPAIRPRDCTVVEPTAAGARHERPAPAPAPAAAAPSRLNRGPVRETRQRRVRALARRMTGARTQWDQWTIIVDVFPDLSHHFHRDRMSLNLIPAREGRGRDERVGYNVQMSIQ